MKSNCLDPPAQIEKGTACQNGQTKTEEKDHTECTEKEDRKEAWKMKIAVITGASSGIGAGVCPPDSAFLYETWMNSWIISRRKDRLEAIAKTCSVPVRIFAGDLTDPMFLQTVKDTLQRLRPDIRMLVNAAGFGKSGTVLDIAKEEWPAQSEMVRLNCEALTNMTLLCAPYLSQGSRILQIASAAAFAPQPQFAVYAATKSYVLSFSRALGAEWKKKGSMSLQSARDLWTQNFLSGAGNLKIRSKK